MQTASQPCPWPGHLLGPSLGTFEAYPLLKLSWMQYKGAFLLFLCPRAKKDTFVRLFLENARKEKKNVLNFRSCRTNQQ